MSAAVVAAHRSDTEVWAGYAIAATIAGTWLAINFGGIFAFPLVGWNWALAVPLVALQTWLATGLFITAHDCMHGSFAPRRPGVNRFVGRLTLMLYAGLDYDRLLPNHFAHHRHVGTALDPDFDVTNPRAPVGWLLRFFGAYYTHWQIARITVVVVAYVLLGASIANIVVFWAVPALLALVQLFFFGTYLPHRHDDTPFADRHNARSSRFGPLLSVLTCFNFGGYHHEHHVYPHLPWWRLPASRRPA
ncbi:MAG: fatty acid desaturase [Janthinobacterium lividum]